MKIKLMASIFGIAITTFSVPSSAGLMDNISGITGGKGSATSSASAEDLVKSYVGGTQKVMSGDAKLLSAVGLKEQAEKAEAEIKNLTQGATAESLEQAAKVQTENNAALADRKAAGNVKMTADGKKLYAAGLMDLALGLKSYMGMSSDIKNFKPSLTSIGSSGNAALFVVKSLPSSTESLMSTLKNAVEFAKENKIEVPSDATAALKF